MAAELHSEVEAPWVFGARKSVVLQELNRQAKRQVALTAATGVAVRWGFGMFPDGGVRWYTTASYNFWLQVKPLRFSIHFEAASARNF